MAGFVHQFSTFPVTTTATQATTLAHQLLVGIHAKANPSNTGVIYLGNSTGVTATSSGAATNGYPLSAGDDVWWPCNLLGDLYVICATTSQQLNCYAI